MLNHKSKMHQRSLNLSEKLATVTQLLEYAANVLPLMIENLVEEMG